MDSPRQQVAVRLNPGLLADNKGGYGTEHAPHLDWKCLEMDGYGMLAHQFQPLNILPDVFEDGVSLLAEKSLNCEDHIR